MTNTKKPKPLPFYRDMMFLSDIFLFLSFLTFTFGIIRTIYVFDINYPIAIGLNISSTFLSWLFFKFLSELCRIICDVASDVKLIRMISETKK